jgi:hypothetical protein
MEPNAHHLGRAGDPFLCDEASGEREIERRRLRRTVEVVKSVFKMCE